MKINYKQLILLTFFLGFIGLNRVSAQSLTSIAVDTALQGQTLGVSITGNNTSFGQGTSTTQVWLSQGGIQLLADSVSVMSPTQLTANFTISYQTPAGFYDVNTYESVDSTLTLSNGFKVISANMGIVSVSPNHSVRGQTLDVMISGNNTNFGQGTNTTQVWLTQGGTQVFANSVTVNSSTEVIANITLPAGMPVGQYDVHTYESVDNVLSLYQSFMVQPTNGQIVSVNADSAIQGQTLNVVITGVNTSFGQGTNTTQVWLSQDSTAYISSNFVVVTSPTEIIANITFPAGAPTGYYNVNTYDPVDLQLSLYSGLHLKELDTCISGIGTISGSQGQSVDIDITGYETSFGLGRAAPQVWLSQGSTIINANTVLVNNTSSVSANFTLPVSAPLGVYNVNVFGSADGLLVLPNGFIMNSFATGITETASALSSDKVYPNPFTNELQVQYTLSRSSDVQITMYDISGRVISTASSVKPAGDHTYAFNANSLNVPAGVYFIRVITNEKNYNYKVVKQ